MISFKHIVKTFNGGKSYVVSDLSFDIHDGETLVLLGTSGCGKTTTLRMINRLVEPTQGSITIDGEDIKSIDRVKLRRSMGYVVQGIGLFPHLTVWENIAIVLRLNGISQEERINRARELLNVVNLNPDTYQNRFPRELSGGQQQRVGVARALSAEPKYLLMDEPFGALDSITRHDLQNELLRLRDKFGKTVVFVTHDIFEALRLGDRIAVMQDGKFIQIGDRNTLLNHPANKYVEELFAKPLEQLKEYQEFL